MKTRWGLFSFVLIAGAGSVVADSHLPKLPPPNPATLLSPASTDALAGALRGYLVNNVPGVLYEGNRGWGQTKSVARGVKWTGTGLSVHPHLQYKEKNDGD